MMIRVSKDLLGIGCGTSAKNLSPSKKKYKRQVHRRLQKTTDTRNISTEELAQKVCC